MAIPDTNTAKGRAEMLRKGKTIPEITDEFFNQNKITVVSFGAPLIAHIIQQPEE